VTCTRRNRSNTPLQSLTLANDKAFLEFAQALAERVLREAPADDAQRVRHAFRCCLSREPSATEQSRLVALLQEQRAGFEADATSAQELAPPNLPPELPRFEAAAWTAVARVLLNLDEFITRE
jgi:hypothetical protein